MRLKSQSFLALFFVATMFACNQSGKTEGSSAETTAATAATGKLPVLSIKEETTYDFGKAKEGDIVEKSFAFQNTGESPLIISNITASCGCTTPEWPKEPIAPGAESNIMVRFNTTGKPGQQNKTVTVTANTEPAVTELHLKGVVEGKQ